MVKNNGKKFTPVKSELAKVKKMLHPNSRKTIAIAKKANKISNRQKSKLSGQIKQSLIGEKMLWIQEHMLPDVCPYTPELTARLLETYIARNDEELEQIAIKRSVGTKRNRQHASREDVLRMTKTREQQEYDTCGIEIPNILVASQCELLRAWDGDLRFLPKFTFRTFGRKDLEKALQRSNKPPKQPSTRSSIPSESSTDEKMEDPHQEPTTEDTEAEPSTEEDPSAENAMDTE